MSRDAHWGRGWLVARRSLDRGPAAHLASPHDELPILRVRREALRHVADAIGEAVDRDARRHDRGTALRRLLVDDGLHVGQALLSITIHGGYYYYKEACTYGG